MGTRLLGVWGTLGIVGLSAHGSVLADTSRVVVEESQHRVTAEVDDRMVRLTVRKRYSVSGGDQHTDAILPLELPPAATVVGLRSRVRGEWRRGELVGQGERAELTNSMQSSTVEQRVNPVVLAWGHLGVATLRLVATAAEREVEYSLAAAPCYTNGAYAVAYPLADGVTPSIQLKSGPRLKVWSIDPQAPSDLRWANIAEECAAGGYEQTGDRVMWLVFELPRFEGVRAAFGRWQLGKERAVARVELELPTELAPRPRRAQVVFLVDASRSMGPLAIETQLDLVRAYLEELPDAEFEVVLYRRYPSRLFGRFVPAKAAPQLLARLSTQELEPGNGSHLDRGLELAGSLLGSRRGAARVVAFTDGMVREELDSDLAAAALTNSVGAVLHLVELQVGDEADRYWFQRRDDRPLAAAATAHGGILMSVRGSAGLSGARDVTRGLVRPVQIDDFVVRIGGEDLYLAGDRGNTLSEGESIRYFGMIADGAEEIYVRGKIWGRAFEQRVRLRPSFSKTLPALIFGDPLWSELDADELSRAAHAAGAVSPATALVTAPEGLDRLGNTRNLGLPGIRLGASQRFCCLYHPPPPTVQARFVDRQAVLRSQLEPGIAACAAAHGRADWAVAVELETTRGEVVDVSVTVGSDTDSDFGDCAEEAVWRLALDPAEFDEPAGRYHVRVAD